MPKISSSAELKEAILLLQAQQAEDRRFLSNQFHAAYENIKPASLVNSLITGVFKSDELKDNLVKSSFGLTSTWISRFLIKSLTRNPLKKFLGISMLYGLTKVVAKNPKTVQYIGNMLVKRFRRKPSGTKGVLA